MLVSMLVRFFLLRFKPSAPNPGEFKALGLDAVESDERFSASFSHFSKRGFNLHMLSGSVEVSELGLLLLCELGW